MPAIDSIEILTFDCYGTLIDWETGLRDVLGELTVRYQVSADVEALLATWEAVQFAAITGPYRSYREIMRDSLRETFLREGVHLTDSDADLLGDRLGSWEPFADTRPALERLRKRFKLGILSNIDDDLLAHSVARLGVPFDELITAQQVQSYKPAPGHFLEALRRFNRPADVFLHCAFGFKYDQNPALRIGMSTAWIKRPGWIRDDEAEPTYEVESLAALVELLEGGGASMPAAVKPSRRDGQ